MSSKLLRIVVVSSMLAAGLTVAPPLQLDARAEPEPVEPSVEEVAFAPDEEAAQEIAGSDPGQAAPGTVDPSVQLPGDPDLTGPVEGPDGPVAPEDPATPQNPADPADPADLDAPLDPADPVDPEVPVDPAVPADPALPVEPVLSAEGAVSGFALAGVTWDVGTAPEGTELFVRTSTGGTWTDWEPLALAESGDKGAPGERDGTEPTVIGAVDRVEVRIVGSDDALPANPELMIIDPGTSAADANVGARSTDSADAAADRPAIFSRAAWGADESMMTWQPQTGSVTGAVVHHTASTNSYGPSDVPGIIRGIYAYHANGRGWGDIGYNFLVDKFGRTWEGRAGGANRGIVGAHTAGVNSVTTGVSVIGDTSAAPVTNEAVEAVSRVIAWKFRIHGVNPASSTVLLGKVQPAIVGHRDVGQTACPGTSLYQRLGQVRSIVSTLVGTPARRGLNHNLVGSAAPDLVLRAGASAWVASDRGRGFGTRSAAGTGFDVTTVPAGDWSGDGLPDLMEHDVVSGQLWVRKGAADGTFPTRQRVSAAWGRFDHVAGGQDWNSDGRPDLLARDKATGYLYFYAGRGDSRYETGVKVGTGWKSMDSVTMVGAFDGATPGLLARQVSTGKLFLYRGNGAGGFLAGKTEISASWPMAATAGVGDWTGDGRNDVVATDRAGVLWLYPGTGTGKLGQRSQIGHGWQGFAAIVTASPSPAGRGLVAVAAGQAFRYPFTAAGHFGKATAVPMALTAKDTDLIYPGDWDGDGHEDLIVRTADGSLMLHQGWQDAFTQTGRKIGHGWGHFEQVVGVGDWVGDGTRSLAALDVDTGRIWLYPGNGRGGFSPAQLLTTGARNADMIIDAGHWRGAGAPDLLVRERGTGMLWLYEGNGPGKILNGYAVDFGWEVMRSITGVGDRTGDGQPDLVAVDTSGTMWLYPGTGRSGFSGRQALDHGVLKGVAVS